MPLKEAYQRFLENLNPTSLASDASLVYVTTTTRYDSAEAIITHLTRQQKIVKKMSDEIITAIEGTGALCADVVTSLEFVSGGGAYLPSLDDNFLVDRTATFPMIHIVLFNDQQQIQQIRLYWDQGSLLKEIEVLGSRGRTWPIRDAKDQTRMIKSSSGTNTGDVSRPAAARAEVKTPTESSRPVSPTKKHIKDPHAAESFFELLSPAGKDRSLPVRAPRSVAAAKPPPREYSELFVGDDATSPSETPSRAKLGSNKNFAPSRVFDVEEDTETPSKKEGNPAAARPKSHHGDEATSPSEAPFRAKLGSNKNFAPSRVFDVEEDTGTPSKKEGNPAAARPKSRHLSQWDFEDFVSPERPKRQSQMQDSRHFGWSDEEPEQNEAPAKPRLSKPRRDAESHFEIVDDGDEEGGGEKSHKRVAGSQHNKGLGLYDNNLYCEENEPNDFDKPNHNLSHAVVSNGHRKKDFDSHWSMADDSPADERVPAGNNKANIGNDRMKHVKMMESSWDTYDESPMPRKVAPRSNHPVRSAYQSSWSLGDDD